jgi:hypothetical protein
VRTEIRATPALGVRVSSTHPPLQPRTTHTHIACTARIAFRIHTHSSHFPHIDHQRVAGDHGEGFRLPFCADRGHPFGTLSLLGLGHATPLPPPPSATQETARVCDERNINTLTRTNRRTHEQTHARTDVEKRKRAFRLRERVRCSSWKERSKNDGLDGYTQFDDGRVSGEGGRFDQDVEEAMVHPARWRPVLPDQEGTTASPFPLSPLSACMSSRIGLLIVTTTPR